MSPVIFFVACLTMTMVSAVLLPVDPWPHDGWYESAQLLFSESIGGVNYAPIAAPAVQYYLTHAAAQLMGFDLEAEFYLSAIFQNVMLALAGTLGYCTYRKIAHWRLAAAVSLGFLLFFIGTGMPQSLLSENITLLLVSLWLYLLVDRYTDPSRQKTTSWLMAVAMAICLAIVVLTRMIPLLLLISFATLFWGVLASGRLFAELALNVICCGSLIVLLMLSNVDRFGRLELSSTMGAHLWQGVMGMSEEALSDAPGYRVLKKIDPQVHGKHWWELPSPEPGMDHLAMDPFLKELAVDAIFKHPFEYARVGLTKFIQTVGAAPYQVGFQKAPQHNPLARDSFLPSLAEVQQPFLKPVAETFTAANTLAHRILSHLYQVIILFIAVTLMLMALVGTKLLPDPWTGSEERATQPLRKSAAWLIFGMAGVLSLVFSYFQAVSITEKIALFVESGLFTVFFLARWLRKAVSTKPVRRHQYPGLLFGFMVFSFFGLLWASWQVETANSRNALPLFPLLGAALVLAVGFWRETLNEPKVVELGRESTGQQQSIRE